MKLLRQEDTINILRALLAASMAWLALRLVIPQFFFPNHLL
jgi:hypothetical protein